MPIQQVVTGFLNLSANFQELITVGLPTTLPLPYQLSANIQFANAVATALGVDQVFIKSYSPAASPQLLNLNSGLSDLNGNAFSIAHCRLFLVVNNDPTAAHLIKIYAGASNGWVALPPSTNPNFAYANGGIFMLVDPNSVGANGLQVSSSNCTVDLDPVANTVAGVSVLIAGSSS
jgi:hypothetical protein